MRSVALAAVLAVSAVAPPAAALQPPATYCQLHPEWCHRLVGPRRARFVGMLKQVIRAVPKVPGYRCKVVREYVDEVGYGLPARLAAPEMLDAHLWCFHRGTDPRKGIADVAIAVELFMYRNINGDEKGRQTEHDKKHDLLVLAEPESVSFVFGKIHESRDEKGVLHRNYTTDVGDREEDVIEQGPYVATARISIGAESRAALDAFAKGLDRAAISGFIAREERRRRKERPGAYRHFEPGPGF